MKAADVMTRNVVSVGPEASVREVAAILVAHHISAVPVVGLSGELLGIVSEGDLMRRAEAETEPRRQWWLELLASNVTSAADFVRLHSNKITDVMTRKVIATAPDTSLAEVAAILERHGIKRVPIVTDGKVVGIVSRANLVQAWASVRPNIPTATTVPSDAAIRDSITARLRKQSWTGPWPLNVIVHDGTVDLWGLVGSHEEKTAIRLVAEETDGVHVVNDYLRFRPAGMAE